MKLERIAKFVADHKVECWIEREQWLAVDGIPTVKLPKTHDWENIKDDIVELSCVAIAYDVVRGTDHWKEIERVASIEDAKDVLGY